MPLTAKGKKPVTQFAPAVIDWDQYEFAFAKAAGSGRAKADTDSGAGPDGQPAPVDPAGVEGHDFGRGRAKPRAGRIGGRHRGTDAGRIAAAARSGTAVGARRPIDSGRHG